MSRRARALARTWAVASALAVLPGVVAPAAVRAASINSGGTDGGAAITQTSTLPLTTTDFTQDNKLVSGNPLEFTKFDSKDGARILDSVTLSVHAKIQNEYGMKFTTPATITTTVATGDANAPGPKITMFQPNGSTPLLSVQAPNDPAALTRSITYGGKPGETLPVEFSSKFDPKSPFYIPPTSFEKTQVLKLSSPADLALFSGSGTLKLPVAASAWSKFTSDSGNGFGSVKTQGSAEVTVTYDWHDRAPAPQTVPEPASVALWGLAGLSLAALRRKVRRA